jgi:hypothetical protein
MRLAVISGLRTIVLLFLLNCGLLSAQVTVSGTVVDPDGAVVPNVDVILKTLSGHSVDSAKTVSDAIGNFHLLRIDPGNYNLQVPAKYGFDEYLLPIHVVAGMHQLHIKLGTPKTSETVTVAPDTTQLELDNSANRDQISANSRMMEKVPVFDQDYVAALTPFLDQAGIATSGVSIIVDGVEMKGTGVSASAIAEARINNDPYSVETNRPGKGRIEIITKPGTPQIHGTLNFTFRDSVFDAKNYFATSKPFEQKRIYEGSITGPIPIDRKTTFLLSGTRQEDNLQSVVLANTPSGITSRNVPTPVHNTEFAARIAHDFSSAHRVSLQYNVSDTISRNFGVGGLVLSQTGTNSQAREDDVIFNDRWIISPTLLNQLQLFYEKDYNPTRSVTNAQKISVDGAFVGGGAQADLLNTENNLKINDIVNWSHKHHYVRFGVNIPNLSRRAWEDHANRLGTYNFSSLAAYESGTPYSFTQQAGVGRAVFWMNEIGAFVQDQMQIRPNLQLIAGLRYDWQTYFKSALDFAPRLSVAYSTPNRKTILRAGVGLFFDRSGAQPMADLKRYNGATLRSFTLLNPTYPNPYPTGTAPSTLPTNLVQRTEATRIPYSLNFSFGVERQIAKSLTVAATYRGTVGTHLFRSRDANAPLPPSYNSGRPDPEFGTIRQLESEARQIGNALDLTLQGKVSRWFSGMAQYTLSHTENNTGGIAWYPANQYTMAGEYGRADFDQRHRFNLLATFNEDHWLNLGAAVKRYSALPYTEISGNDSFHTGILNARPSGINRNTLEGGATTELDLRWSHNLFVSHKGKERQAAFSFAIDAFNITNHTNYLSYIGNAQSTFFGLPTAAANARRLQFTGRIKF